MVGDILQPTHLLLVLIVALVVLGPKRLPEAARSLGNGLRDFKAAISGEHHDHDHLFGPDNHGNQEENADEREAEPAGEIRHDLPAPRPAVPADPAD